MKYLFVLFLFVGIVGCQPQPPVVIERQVQQQPVVIDRRPNVIVQPYFGPWYRPYPYHYPYYPYHR
jgi:hypothetical protein